MPYRPYLQLAPSCIEATVNELVKSEGVRTIGLPALFTTEQELMLVGDLSKATLNLPSTSDRIRDPNEAINLMPRVQELADFAFTKAGILPSFKYTGLIRHKPADRSVIVPVTVNLSYPVLSPWLLPSLTWQKKAIGNPDRVWLDQEETCDVLTRGFVSDNTAAIIRFAVQQNL